MKNDVNNYVLSNFLSETYFVNTPVMYTTEVSSRTHHITQLSKTRDLGLAIECVVLPNIIMSNFETIQTGWRAGE